MRINVEIPDRHPQTLAILAVIQRLAALVPDVEVWAEGEPETNYNTGGVTGWNAAHQDIRP